MIPDPVAYSINSLADVSKEIPNMVVVLSFLVMSVFIMLVFAFAKNLNSARRGMFLMLLLEYCFLILYSTVIYRTPPQQTIRWNFLMETDERNFFVV